MPSKFHTVVILAMPLVLIACSRPVLGSDAGVHGLIDRIGQNELHRSPEQAQRAGFSSAAFGRPFDRLLDDVSAAAVERAKTERLEALGALEQVNRHGVSRDAIRDLDGATFLLDATARIGRHGYGDVDLGLASPYVISQSQGGYADLVKFLATETPVASRASAEAWLARLRGIAVAIGDERRRFEIDVNNGASPPRSVLQRSLDRARALQADDPRNHVLVAYFAEALSQIPDLPEGEIARLIDEAAATVKTAILPAETLLIGDLDRALKTAQDDPGVWRLPDGDAYYADALHFYTSTDLSADQVKQVGLKLVEEISGELDPLLAAAGRTEGGVGQRLAALSADPQYLLPPASEGDAGMIGALDERIKWAETHVGEVILTGPKRPLEIKRSPDLLQMTALARYRAAAIDGSRSASVLVNPKRDPLLPKWSLPTLAFGLTIPGRHLQRSIAPESSSRPILLALSGFAGFSDGWALYAEDLADELGAYKDDSLAKIGYLQSLLVHAAWLVADTGIHRDRWSRERAVLYMVQTTGVSRAAIESDLDRAAIFPGEACAAMIGREKIRALRRQAQTALGPQFELKGFHQAVLGAGARPLSVVANDVEDWVAARRSPPVAPSTTPTGTTPPGPARPT